MVEKSSGIPGTLMMCYPDVKGPSTPYVLVREKHC